MYEYLLSIFFVFRQSAKFISEKLYTFLGGNIDPFYLLAIGYVKNNYKNKKEIKLLFLVFSILVIYGLGHILFNMHINIAKMIVNILKILICYMVFKITLQKVNKINIKKVIYFSSIFLTILTLLALIFNDSTYFWRFNDYINRFSLTRLQLFYLEPSELGFHLILLIIPLSYFVIYLKNKKEQMMAFIALMFNLLSLYLTQSMGAICVGVFAIVCMIIFDLIIHPTRAKIKIYSLLSIIFFIFIGYLIVTKSPLVSRVVATINGNDGSNNYRLRVSINVLLNSLQDYKFIGCGFGNLNTPEFISNYTSFGLTTVIVNAYIYFIIEAGLLGLSFIIYLIYKLLTCSIKQKSVIKFGISIFIITYSFIGGHFTSGLVWALYALIISNEKIDDDLLNEEIFVKFLKGNRHV